MEQEHPLRRYRRENGLTLESVAARVGATLASISRIETRRQNPTRDLLIRISEETGISIEDLVRAGSSSEAA